MTKVILYKDDEHYVGFEMSGHAHYDKINRDIVCAAISILSQSCTNTLDGVLGLKLSQKENSNKGYLQVLLPEDISEEMREKSDLVIKQMHVGLDGIKGQFPRNIDIKIRRFNND